MGHVFVNNTLFTAEMHREGWVCRCSFSELSSHAARGGLTKLLVMTTVATSWHSRINNN